ncbi:MAG: PQQ-dependent sugar dehydrogenase [Planctomycetota bacterium]|nr:PQQ-dependent sugar dehydrogenase [Planctomycetota bacterium]
MRSLCLTNVPLILACLASLAAAADPVARPAFDTQKRVPFTGSRVVGSPDPPAPFVVKQTFPKVKLFEPVAINRVPGAKRFVVAERKGILKTIAMRVDADAVSIGDIGRTVYGVKNGFLYVRSIADPTEGAPKGSRVSRFTVDRKGDWKVDLASEQIVIEWPSGGHNGGNLAFGPDGFLYIACGDGSGIADERQTGQDLSDLLACLLRIDVDHKSAAGNYAIPADNPFVKSPLARGEIFAYGLRQFWKYSFDRQTGDLWEGEVGQDLWEMVLRIEKGGNYGWSVSEGNHPFRPERPLGPSPILKPIFEHPHSDFRSITGGFVYRGTKHKDLSGAYVYGDYDTGKVHALKYVDGKVVWQKELVDTPLRIVTFAEDDAGEIFLVDYMNGTFYELAPNTAKSTAADFPRKLSETGLFASTKDHVPAAGLIPYSVNAELWSDNAIKERFLALPGDGQIEFDGVEYPQPAPGAPRGWRFPDKTVTVKTFSMEMEAGNPASRRRLETRIMLFEQLAGSEEVGDQVWQGFTYLWNDEQTDAVLLEEPGLDRELTIQDAEAPGGQRKQVWHFPSRSECTLCHTMPAKYALGVNTLQLNRDHDYGGGVKSNQIDVFAKLGLFKKQPSKPHADLPRLVDYRDDKQPLELRARSYLQANCAHCHMKWGGGNAEFQLLSTLPIDELGIVNTKPNHGAFALNDPKILVPGDASRSMILHRMTKTGLGRMPHVGSNVVDEKSAKFLREWIDSLPVPAR